MPVPRKGIALESLTWPEAEALFRRTPAPLIVLPVGARTKEHGLHLPLNNDWILAEYLLMRVLDALPVVALPGIPYGYYPAFLEYPGSVSLRREVFRDVVVDICSSISRHGPGKFYSPTGAWGDPTLATADKGRVVAEALVSHVVDFLERFARPDFVPTPPLSRYLG